MKNFGAMLMIVGYLCMASAVISGVGYGLYLLGVVGLTFGLAAWSGFVLFAKLLGGGFVSLIVGGIMMYSK